MRPQAAIFDLGGVVFESPIHHIREFERRHGHPSGLVGRVLGSNDPDAAWPRWETGRVERHRLLAELSEEFRSHGVELDVDGLLHAVEAALVVRPEMIEAIRQLRAGGIRVAALTNNWSPMASTEIATHFDVFVESVVEGVRKPDPVIYLRTLDRLAAEAGETVMLDDLGVNLKPAREMGMTTHLVFEVEETLAWLADTFGWSS